MIEVRIMELEEREQFTLSGGTKQDRARALFVALLPDDGTCYTAAEVVKYSLGRKEDHDHYVAHYKALDSLARVHGIGDGKIPGPDNVDPATNSTLSLGRSWMEVMPRPDWIPTLFRRKIGPMPALMPLLNASE